MAAPLATKPALALSALTTKTALTLAALSGFLLVGGCRAPKRPPPPEPAPAVVERLSSTGELRPYLDSYPLGDRGTRLDLLARNPDHSMHLSQTNQVVPAHSHPQAVMRAYVLTGRGTFYVEGRSYPAVPGSTFRVEKGMVHSVQPDSGDTLVSLVFFEPPQGDTVERVLAENP